MIFDAHCDIWTDITRYYQSGETDAFRKYHYERLKEGGFTGGIFAIWNDLPQGGDALKRTTEMQKAIQVEEETSKDILRVARSCKDMDDALENGTMFAFIGHEGLQSIGNDIEMIGEFFDFGARHASLTWNEENQLATGAKGSDDRGLTDLGKRAVWKIESLGMLLDISHLNDRSIWDVFRAAHGPIVSTHANARVLCNVPRNLTDDQMREIAKTGGVVGINAYNGFVSEDKNGQTAIRLEEHMKHMIDIMGIDHVGFGFDFCEYLERDALSPFCVDKSLAIAGLEDASKMNHMTELMKADGFTANDIDKVSFRNWQRVITQVLKY